jgi:hypothetical protein
LTTPTVQDTLRPFDDGRVPSSFGTNERPRLGELMPELDLTPLREFGEEAERLELPRIAEGGIIVPGRDSTFSLNLGKEESAHGQRAEAGEEAGPAAGSRERPPAEAAASGAPAHALGPVTVTDVLEELRDYGAKISVVRSSSRFAHIWLPVGLFSGLPFRAELLLEVPLVTRQELRRGVSGVQASVPDVRAWARWRVGGKLGELIKSHHEYPDQSMCVCMPHQWRLGHSPLIHYVDFCVVWIGKALHEREVGFYPGPQHYPERVRVQRDRAGEYCGCGSSHRYRECHRAADHALTLVQRVQHHHAATQAYLAELEMQGRSKTPPTFAE